MDNKELENIIASLQETAKVLDGKVVLDATAFAGVQAKVSELEKTNAAYAEKVETFEAERTMANAKAYVSQKESEMVAAAAAKEVEISKRKDTLKEKGFSSEKTIARAINMSTEDFNEYVIELTEAKETAKIEAVELAKKAIKDNQEEFTAAKDKNTEDAEINLAENLTPVEKMRQKIGNKIRKANKSK